MTTNNIDHIDPLSLKYAQALMGLDYKKEDLDELNNILTKTPELLDVLKSPIIKTEDKNNIINKVFENKLTKNFIKVLVKNGIINMVFEVMAACENIFMMRSRTLMATLTCVVAPDEKQLEAMTKLICKKNDCKDVKWEIVKDDSLISGFIINVDGQQYDYSTKSQLRRLKANLTRR